VGKWLRNVAQPCEVDLGRVGVRAAEPIDRQSNRTPIIFVTAYPSAECRLPNSLHFAESDVIIGVVRARSVHEVGYGHGCDWAA
jgi:hypothetical protein